MHCSAESYKFDEMITLRPLGTRTWLHGDVLNWAITVLAHFSRNLCLFNSYKSLCIDSHVSFEYIRTEVILLEWYSQVQFISLRGEFKIAKTFWSTSCELVIHQQSDFKYWKYSSLYLLLSISEVKTGLKYRFVLLVAWKLQLGKSFLPTSIKGTFSHMSYLMRSQHQMRTELMNTFTIEGLMAYVNPSLSSNCKKNPSSYFYLETRFANLSALLLM